MMAGVDMVHVPYRGTGPALTDLIGGQVQIYFDAIPASLEHIKTGKCEHGGDGRHPLRGAARGSRFRRLRPGYEATFWAGFVAPKKYAQRNSREAHREINAALADPKIKMRITELGGSPFRVRLPSSANSSPTRPKSGARW